MISKTATAFLMLGILGVLTEGCYNCIGYGRRRRKKRETPTYEDVKDDVARYYIDCLPTKESAVYYEFPNYTSPVKLTVYQMRWFKTAYAECSPLDDLKEKNECWLNTAHSLLRPDSKYLEATLACICKDYDDKASYCKGRKKRRASAPQRGVGVLSSLEQKSASCMQNKVKDDKTGNDMNSNMIYITKHVSRCSFSARSTKCRAISESSSEKNNLRDLIDGTMIPGSNFREFFKSCPPEDVSPKRCSQNHAYTGQCKVDGEEIICLDDCRKEDCCYDDDKKICFSSKPLDPPPQPKCPKGHIYSEKCIVGGEEITRRYPCTQKAPACCYDDIDKKCFSTIVPAPICTKFAPCFYTTEDRVLTAVGKNRSKCRQQKHCCWNCEDKMCYESLPVEAEEVEVERSLETGIPILSLCDINRKQFACTYIKEEILYTVSTNRSVCDQQKHCCWNEKEKTCNISVSEDGTDDISPTPISNETNIFPMPDTMDEPLQEKENEMRSLLTGPPQCQPPKKFPFTCQPIDPNVPYVLEPPTNIPYCLRVPCSLDRQKQSIYDKDIRSCGSQPGCYFDKELAEFRKYNVPIMPGVPVCHLAIRNAIFWMKAQIIVSLLGYWNPFFTYCILKKCHDEIYKGPIGCSLLPLLELFGIPGKMAGWGSITEYECYLIGACWRDKRGCFYPVDLNAIVVKSGQRLQFNPHEVVFGRPKCQHFSKRNSYEMLQSYHRCLLAGCSVDINILAGYYNNLFDIGKDMSPQDHWKYWEECKAGRIGAHNLENIHWTRANNGTTTPVPTTTKPIFLIPGGFGSSGIFGGVGPSTTLQDFKCGPASKFNGGRPCPPPSTKPPVFHLVCPYKVVSFPKFPRLKGSVEGCCDINECYITTREIREMHSGPSSYWSQWSFFSSCSSTCGRGTQTRTRKCIRKDDKGCVGPDVETRHCTQAACGNWSPWSPWTACRICVDYIKTRSRVCIPKFTGVCAGPNQESAPCPHC